MNKNELIKTDVHTYPKTYEHYKVMLEQQAEISFKIGQASVVDKENINYVRGFQAGIKKAVNEFNVAHEIDIKSPNTTHIRVSKLWWQLWSKDGGVTNERANIQTTN